MNIAGSRGREWAGPCAEDFTEETFQMIVDSVRTIIDGVKPLHAFYTLETMQWMYPDSTESYRKLVDAIDRKEFGVHFDPVNIIWSPHRYFNNGQIIKDFIKEFGTLIKSCHGKDTLMGDQYTVHLDEVVPGKGSLDYHLLLRELEKVDPDMPLILEHLTKENEYAAAADYVFTIAQQEGITI